MSTAKARSEVLDSEHRVDGVPLREGVPSAYELPGVLIARLHGFDEDETPLVAGVPSLPGEIVRARSAVALQRTHIGSDLVVVFEGGNATCPIILGALSDRRTGAAFGGPSGQPVSVQADDERVIIEAEREIVLRCGNAAITLTRAGKVIIKGNYIVSRSSGYNKIKGAAVDIN
jgi:hypothetical protein